MPASDANPVKIFYNSACPVCNAGIQSICDNIDSQTVLLHDVHTTSANNLEPVNDVIHELNAEREFIRERLHVIDSNEEVKVGIDALITLWGQSSNQNWKAGILQIPLVHGISRVSYNIFARLLYWWNRYQKRW